MKGYTRKRSTSFPPRELSSGIVLKHRPSFFARHARSLSLVGALIVLGTYICKEVLQERVKSHLEDLDRAQLRFSTAFEDDTTDQELKAMIERALSPAVRDDLNPEDYIGPLLTISEDIYRIEKRNSHFMLDTETFAEPLPKEAAFDGSGAFTVKNLLATEQNSSVNLSRKLNALHTQMETFEEDCASNKFRSSNTMLNAEGRTALNNLRNSYEEVYLDVLEGRDEAKNVRQAVLMSQESYRTSLGEKSRSYSVIGYFLYSIGWGINLLGPLFGIKLGGGSA